MTGTVLAGKDGPFLTVKTPPVIKLLFVSQFISLSSTPAYVTVSIRSRSTELKLFCSTSQGVFQEKLPQVSALPTSENLLLGKLFHC